MKVLKDVRIHMDNGDTVVCSHVDSEQAERIIEKIKSPGVNRYTHKVIEIAVGLPRPSHYQGELFEVIYVRADKVSHVSVSDRLQETGVMQGGVK